MCMPKVWGEGCGIVVPKVWDKTRRFHLSKMTRFWWPGLFLTRLFWSGLQRWGHENALWPGKKRPQKRWSVQTIFLFPVSGCSRCFWRTWVQNENLKFEIWVQILDRVNIIRKIAIDFYRSYCNYKYAKNQKTCAAYSNEHHCSLYPN